MKRFGKKIQAFTLIELLIVIAMIALLAALLLPALAPSNNIGQRIYCTNNQKQIGIAFRLTSGDFDPDGKIFLLDIDAATNPIPNQPALKPSAGQSNGPGQGAQFVYQIFAVMSNELNTPKLIVCPQDERVAHTNFGIVPGNSVAGAALPGGGTALYNGNISYWVARDVKEYLPKMIQCGDRNIGDGAKTANQPNSRYGYSPDVGVGSGWVQSFGTNGSAAAWTEKIHGKAGGNVLFADGHVEGLSSAMLSDALKVTGDTTTVSPASVNSPGNVILFP
jgi:prepilin-type processing-associated H-X9-DG protein/prepilin-type N-terminal cleavage/methylation domain-containing protein